MGYTFSQATMIGKVLGEPKTKGGDVLVYVNVPERQQAREGYDPPEGAEVDQNGYYWQSNLVFVKAGGKHAEKWARLKDGERVVVRGTLDDMPYNTTNREGSPATYRRTIVRAYGMPLRGGSDNLNSVVVLGRVGEDFEFRLTGSGYETGKFSLVVDVREEVDGEWKDRGVWLRVEMLGKRCNQARNLIRKGGQVLLEGRLQRRTYRDDAGNKQEFGSFKTFDFLLVGGKPGNRDGNAEGEMPEDDGEWGSGGGFGQDDGGMDDYGAPSAAQRTAAPAPAPERNPYKGKTPPDLDDEIPF